MKRFAVRLADWEADRGKLKAVRHAVFVVEQGVPEELEWDDIDPDCTHVIAEDGGGQPIGCGRLLPDGHVGRMAVLKPWRGAGVGATLLARLIELARAGGYREAVLHAQTRAAAFYAQHGFRVTSPEFEEAGMPHVEMRLPLRAT